MCAADPKFLSPATLTGWVPVDLDSLRDIAYLRHQPLRHDAAWGIDHVTIDGVVYYAASRLGGVA